MADRILIITGDGSLGWELYATLTGADYNIFVAAAWTPKIAMFTFDIAIVDEVLPSGDGKDLCSQLRVSLGIPVILLGEDSGGEGWERAVEAGADAYVVKTPDSPREVAARVKAILRRYKEARV